MRTETIRISGGAALTTYLWEDSEELKVTCRPAVLVFPGGAYMMCSDREAEPVALAYMNEGFNAFVLRYTTIKDFAPAFEEAQAALNMIRSRADEWHVIPDRVAVCGFSAGGHLACAMGIMAENKPNAMVLGYPAVIGHLWEKLTDKVPDLVSQVKSDAAPCFLVSCRDDDVVPVINTIQLMAALDEQQIPFESHVFAKGGHGFSLAKWHTASGGKEMVNPAASAWLPMSVDWLKTQMGDIIVKESDGLPKGLAPCIYMSILDLVGQADTNEILLKYSGAFASEQLLAMAGKAPLATVLIPLELTHEQMLALANELQAVLDARGVRTHD